MKRNCDKCLGDVLYEAEHAKVREGHLLTALHEARRRSRIRG